MSNNIEQFTDPYIKNILDFGSVDIGQLSFSRQYSFALSASPFSLTSSNTFVHSFDQSLYPTTLTSATGFGIYASQTNSFSGHHYANVMQLFNYGALAKYDGLFSTTSITSSVSSINFMNVEKFDMSLLNGDATILHTLSASLTGAYIYNFDRSVFGDRIYDGSLSMWNNGTLVAFDNGGLRNNGIYTLSGATNSYGDSLTSATRFWVLPDIGRIVTWSTDRATMNSLSAVNRIDFRNSVTITNATVNLRIEPDEFNQSENLSYYLKDYTDGHLPDTWITTIGLYNPWNDLIAVCKVQKPIRKSANLPLTFKIVVDFL